MRPIGSSYICRNNSHSLSVLISVIISVVISLICHLLYMKVWDHSVSIILTCYLPYMNVWNQSIVITLTGYLNCNICCNIFRNICRNIHHSSFPPHEYMRPVCFMVFHVLYSDSTHQNTTFSTKFMAVGPCV